ncbi:ABC transporter ATP-binding protein [Acidiphilium sp. AL]|uniref:ABC transporter ATP-binding protein n=1 Tax=Acidiphilium iwatense TaxID=768198 RepID=A0ABS9DXN4_9PROT|nr:MULTISPECIES: ABC transporter ATP-binding protein [Acidiphilium]MCF3946451.1 ABC transporter ATP-binding protein [Acidiphilium iwatense]MCU4158621.1 ABC transporter ATP-binding protein [Acidiphilium sp. AL]
MSAVLQAEGLQTYYGKSHILHGVSLTVGQGELIALLGRNGAGKTTTMRSIMGLTAPREGMVRLFGRDTTGIAPYRVAGMGVGYVPEGRKIFGHLTVHENLLVPPQTKGPWTIPAVYQLFPRLEERRTSKGGRLSGGEQEMLSIARALLLNPKFLILDEPSQGLAPVIVQEVMLTVGRMKSEGMSILLVEQNAFLALKLADRAYVLSDGEVVYDGSAAELAADTTRMENLAGVSHI